MKQTQSAAYEFRNRRTPSTKYPSLPLVDNAGARFSRDLAAGL